MSNEPLELFIITLKDKETQQHFINFLKTEYCDELLSFWTLAELYEAQDEEQRKKTALFLWNDFLSQDAEKSISLHDDFHLIQIEESIKANTFSPTLFVTVKDYVFSILFQNSFPRYLKKASLSQVMLYKLKRSELPELVVNRFIRECHSTEWKEQISRKGVKIYSKVSPDSIEAIKSTSIFSVNISQLEKVILSMESRKEWDPYFEEGEILEPINETTDIVWMKYKDIRFSIPQEKRDLVLHRSLNRLPNGNVLILHKSTTHPKCPEMKGVNRGDALVIGWLIEVIPEGNLVTYYQQIDNKGSQKLPKEFSLILIQKLKKILSKEKSVRKSQIESKLPFLQPLKTIKNKNRDADSKRYLDSEKLDSLIEPPENSQRDQLQSTPSKSNVWKKGYGRSECMTVFRTRSRSNPSSPRIVRIQADLKYQDISRLRANISDRYLYHHQSFSLDQSLSPTPTIIYSPRNPDLGSENDRAEYLFNNKRLEFTDKLIHRTQTAIALSLDRAKTYNPLSRSTPVSPLGRNKVLNRQVVSPTNQNVHSLPSFIPHRIKTTDRSLSASQAAINTLIIPSTVQNGSKPAVLAKIGELKLKRKNAPFLQNKVIKVAHFPQLPDFPNSHRSTSPKQPEKTISQSPPSLSESYDLDEMFLKGILDDGDSQNDYGTYEEESSEHMISLQNEIDKIVQLKIIRNSNGSIEHEDNQPQRKAKGKKLHTKQKSDTCIQNKIKIRNEKVPSPPPIDEQ